MPAFKGHGFNPFSLKDIFWRIMQQMTFFENIVVSPVSTIFLTFFNYYSSMIYRDFPYVYWDVFQVICCRFVVWALWGNRISLYKIINDMLLLPFPTNRRFLMPLQPKSLENISTKGKLLIMSNFPFATMFSTLFKNCSFIYKRQIQICIVNIFIFVFQRFVVCGKQLDNMCNA